MKTTKSHAEKGNIALIFPSREGAVRLIEAVVEHRRLEWKDLGQAAGVNPVKFPKMRKEPETATPEMLQKIINGLHELEAIDNEQRDGLNRVIAKFIDRGAS